MASGTGNLPNPGMDFTPFDILTAEEMDDLVENIESLADGSGIGDGAITPEKRSGGFKIITHAFANSTGSQSITGVGFKPKAIVIIDSLINSGSGVTTSSGVAVDGNPIVQFSKRTYSTGTDVSNTAAFLSAGSAGAAPFQASVTSFDNDGITVNVTTATSAVTREFTILFLA